MKLSTVAIAVVGVMGILVGCAAPPLPGASEGAVPPQIVKGEEMNKWDNPASFGPVPANLVKDGATVCDRLNTPQYQFKAIGYHSKAKDIDGKTYPDGGYYCALK